MRHQQRPTGRRGGSRVLAPALVAAPLAFLSFGQSANALTINVTYDSSITTDPNAAAIEGTIMNDVNALETYIANPVQVNLTFQEGTTGLGGSSTFIGDLPYTDYVNDLKTKQTVSADDTTAIASLGVSTNNPVNGNADVQITEALARALGETGEPANTTDPDSTITFNKTIVNDSRTGPQVNGNYDLQSVLAHEMDEALGTGGTGSTLESGGSVTGPVGPLDLYRYSAPGTRSYSTAALASNPYFSIDGGLTDLVHFNQTTVGDYADWGNPGTPEQEGNIPPQVQDAFGSPNQEPNLGQNVMIALDVVGWNLTPAGTLLEEGVVPEPATLGMIGLGVCGLLVRRRRR